MIYDFSTNTDLVVGSANYEGSAHVILFQVDRTNVIARIVTELETLSSAIVLAHLSGGSAVVLGDNGAFTSFPCSPDTTSIYMCVAGWANAAAEISAANAAIIVDRLWNGPAVTSIAVSPSTLTIAPPSTSQLTATAMLVDSSTYDATELASWSTSDATIATVSVGLVDAIATGSATVTASMTSLGASSASGTCAVTVIPALTSLVVAPVTAELLTVGASQALTATAHYSDGSTADVTSSATWTSERTAVAVVDSSGIVTAVSKGAAQVSATFASIAGSASSDASVLVSTMIDAYTGVLVSLLPPGRAWRLFAESLLYQLFAGCAAELSRLDARVADLLNEDDPSTAVELLPDYESEFEIDSSGTIAQRQANIIAAEISQQGTRPADYQATLASVLDLAPSDVVVIERSPGNALAMGDAREIFRFFVYRDPTLPGSYSVDAAQAIIDKIKQSHTVGQVIESTALICDDPHSLCDRDLLGA